MSNEEIGKKVRAIALDAMENNMRSGLSDADSPNESLDEHIKHFHGGVMPKVPCEWMKNHGMGVSGGAEGETGASGATGVSGASGVSGSTGISWQSGMSGAMGAGATGASGETGETGGITGATGESGQQDGGKFKGIKDGKIYKDGKPLEPTFQDGGTQSKWRLARNKWVKELLDKDDGTFDLESGKPVSYQDGFQLAFQTTDSEDGGMDDAEYDRLVDELSKATGSKPHLGNFEVPEVSFWVKDRATAIQLMQKHNQHSIWNWKKSRIIMNKNLDTTTNAVKQGAQGATGASGQSGDNV